MAMQLNAQDLLLIIHLYFSIISPGTEFIRKRLVNSRLMGDCLNAYLSRVSLNVRLRDAKI